MNTYEIISNILIYIEKNIKEDLSVNILAKLNYISSVHLQRLFKITTNLTLKSYIRDRKLAHSLDLLFHSNLNINSIALEYGFKYDQSYIRAFKKYFNITPTQAKLKQIPLSIQEKIDLKYINKIGEGLSYGPELVIVPNMKLIGKKHKIYFEDNWKNLKANKVAKDFFKEYKNKIPNALNNDVYIGLTTDENWNEMCSNYFTSTIVKNFNSVPSGLCKKEFSSCLCAKFIYIGNHHYYDITLDIAKDMYSAMQDFFSSQDRYIKYSHSYFEKIDTSSYDGTFCKMEWFIPIKDKKKI